MNEDPLLIAKPAWFTWLPVWIPALIFVASEAWILYDGEPFSGARTIAISFLAIAFAAIPTAHLRYELWSDRLRVVHPFWHRDIELHRIVTSYETQPSQSLGPYSSNGLAIELRTNSGGPKIETLWPKNGQVLLTALLDLLHSFGFRTTS